MSTLQPHQRIEILELVNHPMLSAHERVAAAQTLEQYVTGNVPPTPPMQDTDCASEKAVQPEVLYEVVAVVRYVARRFDLTGNSVPSAYTDSAEYDSEEMAFAVATALAKGEQQQHGFGPGDERLRFPSARDLSGTIRKALQERYNG